MNSFHCRCWLSAVFVLYAASAQAERIPITLNMTTVNTLGSPTNIPFTAIAPNTLRLQTITCCQNPQTIYDELMLDAAIYPPIRGIRSGAAGNLAIVDGEGNTRTITGVQAGETIRCVIKQVNTSGSTIASPTTNLLGLR